MTRRWHILVVLSLLVGGSAHASPAKVSGEIASTPTADSRRMVGILDVKVDGVPKEIAAQFEKNLDTQLDRKRFWVAPRDRLHERLANSTKWTEGCLIGKCLREVKVQTGADLVLLAALTGSGTSFGYVVTLVRTDTGRVVAQESERCDVCTVNEALSAATLATVKIVNAVPNKLPDGSEHGDAEVALATRSLHDELDHHRHHTKVLGLSLAVAGLVAAGVGAYLYAQNSHSNAAVATLAAGAGVAAGGVCVLTF